VCERVVVVDEGFGLEESEVEGFVGRWASGWVEW